VLNHEGWGVTCNQPSNVAVLEVSLRNNNLNTVHVGDQSIDRRAKELDYAYRNNEHDECYFNSILNLK
jgi:hypothetical protein